MIERNAALKEASINLHGTESETLHVSPEFFAEAENSAISIEIPRSKVFRS